MERILENVKKTKSTAKIGSIFVAIFLFGFLGTLITWIFLAAYLLTIYKPGTKITPHEERIAMLIDLFFILFIIFVILFAITNIIVNIMLIMSSSSIYIPNEVKDDAEVVSIIKSYKSLVVILAIIGFFLSLIFIIAVWISSNNKISFLKSKIKQLEKQANKQN